MLSLSPGGLKAQWDEKLALSHDSVVREISLGDDHVFNAFIILVTIYYKEEIIIIYYKEETDLWCRAFGHQHLTGI